MKTAACTVSCSYLEEKNKNSGNSAGKCSSFRQISSSKYTVIEKIPINTVILRIHVNNLINTIPVEAVDLRIRESEGGGRIGGDDELHISPLTELRNRRNSSSSSSATGRFPPRPGDKAFLWKRVQKIHLGLAIGLNDKEQSPKYFTESGTHTPLVKEQSKITKNYKAKNDPGTFPWSM